MKQDLKFIRTVAPYNGEIGWIAKHLMASRGSLSKALREVEAKDAPRSVVEFFKAAVDAGSTISGNWGNPLADYETSVAGFIGSLQNFGAFDHMLPDMKQVPLHTRAVLVTTGATGATVGEGQSKPISSLQLAGTQIPDRKAICIVVASDELMRFSGDLGRRLIEQELQNAVAVETDRTFIAEIRSGATATASSGSTADKVWTDIGVGLSGLTITANSKIYWIMTPTIATKLLTKTTTDGTPIFPSQSRDDVPITFIPIASDGVASGEMLFVDATQIAAAGGTLELSISHEASVQMNSTPDSPPTSSTILTSLWQNNCTGLRAERFFGAEKLRASAATVITGVSY